MTDTNNRTLLQCVCLVFVIQLIGFMHKTEAQVGTHLFPGSSNIDGTTVVPNSLSNVHTCSGGRTFGLYFDQQYGHVSLNTTVVEANFSVEYNCSADLNSQILFVYSYNEDVNETTAVRVYVSSPHPEENFPLMIVVRQQEGILSWAIPLYIDNSYPYNFVSRTLCPMNKKQRTEMTSHQTIYVELSTMFTNKTNFLFRAEKLNDFQLIHEQAINVSVMPSEPQYFMYTFPDGISSVHLKVTSHTKICMAVSVQDIQCPVFDLDRNVGYRGKHQTMTTQAAMFLERDDYESGSLYVVLITKTQDYECVGIETIRQASDTRNKTVTIYIQTALSSMQYYKAIFSTLAVFLSFYVMAAIIGCVYHGCGWNKDLSNMTEAEKDKLLPYHPSNQPVSPDSSDPEEVNERKPLYTRTAPTHYGTVESVNSESAVQKELRSVSTTTTDNNSDVMIQPDQLDTSDIDFLPDAELEKSVIRTKTAMFVSDLARKSSKKLGKMYKIYHWNLLTISIFYGLPVAQLVITYQKVLRETGNDDLCFYNFDCAHPFGVLSSFNNVFSNIGYVLLGFLFIFLVWRRNLTHKKFVASNVQLEKLIGIPQHFGLFYAMGLALVMEGIMSACYHVCPNYSNFQFDTSFMYIIACLNILKIYQTRHPDINAKAYQTYFFMAVVIFIAVVGVVYATSLVWILYGLIHMLASLLLTGQVYYMGTWKIDRHIFRRILHIFLTDGIRCAKPTYTSRFLLLFIGNVINWSFALYGAIEQPSDFATYLLAIFIGNLLLYSLFYIIMKLLSGEKLLVLPLTCILLAAITWSAGMYFFFARLTSWQKTPAGSREGNKDCILLQFYDHHDIWHFLSAISLFFSFLILLTLDDDLTYTRRDRIPVF